MKDSDPLLSVHMAREIASKAGIITPDTAEWRGYLSFQGVRYTALLSAYGRSDQKLSTETVRLTLDPMDEARGVRSKVIQIMEHANKATHIAGEIDPKLDRIDPYRPVHWKFNKPITQPGPISVGDIDIIHHTESRGQHDAEELDMFWQLSQTIDQINK